MNIHFYKIITLLFFSSLTSKGLCQIINLSDSSRYYLSKNEFTKSAYWGEKLVDSMRSASSVIDTTLAVALNDLAVCYYSAGTYQKAKPLYEEASMIFENKGYTRSQNYIDIINNLGNVYKQLGSNNIAEAALQKSISLQEEVYGTNNDKYALYQNNLGHFYGVVGKYENAEYHFNRAIQVYESLSMINSVDYARSMDNLANILLRLAKYKAAEAAYVKALGIRRKVLGDKDWQYGASLNNLGGYYLATGNNTLALKFIKDAAEVVKNTLGENHPQYSIALGNIGNVYSRLGDHINAVLYAQKSLDILVHNHDTLSLRFITGLQNIAGNYFRAYADANAKSYYEQSLGRRKKVNGDENIDYILSATNLGICYLSCGASNQADSIFNATKKIIDKLSLQNHPELAIFYKQEIKKIQDNGEWYNLNVPLSSLLINERTFLKDKLSFLSESELINYIGLHSQYFDIAYRKGTAFLSHATISLMLDNLCLIKGLSANNTARIFRNIERTEDSITKSMLQNFRKIKNQVSKQATLPITSRTENTDSLSALASSLEKSLILRSQEYSSYTSNIDIGWSVIKSCLADNELVIEYKSALIEETDVRKQPSKLIIAFLYRKRDSLPIYVPLCTDDYLIKAMANFSYKSPSYVNTITPPVNAQRLYSLLWLPVTKHLTGIKKIYFSPDGLLHQIAFAAIPTPDKKLLSDKYQLVQLTSTRELMNKDTAILPKSAMFFGGIDYNSQNTDTTTKPNLDAYAFVYQQSHRGIVDSFRYLNHTLPEVKTAGQQLSKLNTRTYLYQGGNASESNFRSAIQTAQPSILHFATHGFTITDSTAKAGVNTAYTATKNPLLRTGLVMAGGNNGWKARNKWDEDDGILTGMEIANLRLDSTELVVLSACETANGEIQGSEGVFGLQRAFKLAGAKYIMATLWQVPDKETKEFMNLFYSRLAVKNTTIPDAFYYTQKTMRKKYPPFYWAGFTLIK